MRNVALLLLGLPVWMAGLVLVPYVFVVWLVTGKNAHVFNWLISLDQLGNTLVFGNPDETISSRAGRCAKKGGNRPCYWLCRLLHVLDKNHCEKSIGT